MLGMEVAEPVHDKLGRNLEKSSMHRSAIMKRKGVVRSHSHTHEPYACFMPMASCESMVDVDGGRHDTVQLSGLPHAEGGRMGAGG